MVDNRTEQGFLFFTAKEEEAWSSSQSDQFVFGILKHFSSGWLHIFAMPLICALTSWRSIFYENVDAFILC